MLLMWVKVVDLSLLEVATLASNIANIIVAFANILLVLYVSRQLRSQRTFFLQQSERDARAKISEAWQRFNLELLTRPKLSAKTFWPADSEEYSERLVAYSYLLNTLHNEFRFAASGVHDKDAFLKTLLYFIGTIDNLKEIADVKRLTKTLGFGEDFVRTAIPILDDQENKLRASLHA
jgi:hypothetical protein